MRKTRARGARNGSSGRSQPRQIINAVGAVNIPATDAVSVNRAFALSPVDRESQLAASTARLCEFDQRDQAGALHEGRVIEGPPT